MITRTIATNSPKLLAMIVAIVVAELTLAGGVWLILEWRARDSASTRLGIGSDLADFNAYVVSHFTTGMTRKEVIKQADVIGSFTVKPFYVGDEYCEAYSFNIGPFGTR